jgi:FMN phosphatase YigB (HAD superfamily)
MTNTVYEFQTRVQAVADIKSTKLTYQDKRDIEHDRWAELQERFQHGQLFNKTWQLWEVETGKLSNEELKEFEILTEAWERQLGNMAAIRKPALECLKEIRKEIKIRNKNASK